MDTILAFAMGQANRDKESMVFDWNRAAEIIKERKVKNASAGLSGDWSYTGGRILENGSPVSREDTCVYLASTWAVPELEIDGDVFPCYKMQSETPNWDSSTYWPESARMIISPATDDDETSIHMAENSTA